MEFPSDRKTRFGSKRNAEINATLEQHAEAKSKRKFTPKQPGKKSATLKYDSSGSDYSISAGELNRLMSQDDKQDKKTARQSATASGVKQKREDKLENKQKQSIKKLQ